MNSYSSVTTSSISAVAINGRKAPRRTRRVGVNDVDEDDEDDVADDIDDDCSGRVTATHGIDGIVARTPAGSRCRWRLDGQKTV